MPSVNQIAGFIPDRVDSIEKAIQESPDLSNIMKGDDEGKKTYFDCTRPRRHNQTNRNTCLRIIIGKDDLENYLPICKDSRANLLITQYDGSYVESVGMLKMDFLGLKTLSIIKECLEYIEATTGKVIDIDSIPLDDKNL